MLGLLALLGLGLGLAALIGGSDDDAAAETSLELGDDEDVVVDETYRPDLIAEFDDLVGEGEITQAQADQALALVSFVSGPMNINAGGGDDYLLLGEGNQTVDAGAGNDLVLAGQGDDRVDLGDDNDAYGTDFRSITTEDDILPFPSVDPDERVTEADVEGGNDTINGGVGSDAISDSFGSNVINGQQGADFIVSVDDASDEGTADTVNGGFGFDMLVVDEGDVVSTGNGQDSVVVETYGGVEAGYNVVTVTDFETRKDALVLQGQPDLLSPGGGGNPLTVEVSENGQDAIVLINNIPVVRVAGVPGLTADDVTIFVDSR